MARKIIRKPEVIAVRENVPGAYFARMVLVRSYNTKTGLPGWQTRSIYRCGYIATGLYSNAGWETVAEAIEAFNEIVDYEFAKPGADSVVA